VSNRELADGNATLGALVSLPGVTHAIGLIVAVSPAGDDDNEVVRVLMQHGQCKDYRRSWIQVIQESEQL
jgi:hypothetical protein